jgi:hypothetical protein
LPKDWCVIATGKIFSGWVKKEINKEIPLITYPDFRAEELLYWQMERYHGSSPGKWIILTEAQLRKNYLDSYFMFRPTWSRGHFYYM